jgi:hypothetical protein
MWPFGYFAFVVAFALGLRWAQQRPRRARATMVVAAAALATGWLGLVLLIPASRTHHFDTSTWLPELGIAAYAVAAGLLAAWVLSRGRRLGTLAFVAWFTLAYTVLLLAGLALAVGLSKGS